MARPMLGWAGAATAAALAAALVPLPTTSASNADRPARSSRPAAAVEERAVPAVLPAERTGGDVVARLARTRTDAYRMIAVTWAADGADPSHVEVRLRAGDGWSGWRHLDPADDGPARAPVEGTVPLWTGRADGVAVRVAADGGVAPDELRVSTIEPGPGPTTAPPARTGAGRPIGGPSAFPGRPAIVTREQWGADPDLGDRCDAPIYGRTTKAAIVHHTAGTNDYSRSESDDIVRGILAYHTQSQHWCDIGYNFLVDRFGRVYEGRDGGMAKPVRGAHAGDFNVNTVGISMMGSFENADVPQRLRNAVVRTIGWRLGTAYVRPRGHTTVYGKRIDRISGHRDVMPTACPGERGHRWLPRLRDRVAGYLSAFESPIQAKRDTLGARRTGPVFVGERRIAGGRRTRFARGVVYWNRDTGAHYLPDGALLRGYVDRGGAAGRFGFPERDSRRTGDGAVARFEHGELRYDRRTGTLTARYW